MVSAVRWRDQQMSTLAVAFFVGGHHPTRRATIRKNRWNPSSDPLNTKIWEKIHEEFLRLKKMILLFKDE